MSSSLRRESQDEHFGVRNNNQEGTTTRRTPTPIVVGGGYCRDGEARHYYQARDPNLHYPQREGGNPSSPTPIINNSSKRCYPSSSCSIPTVTTSSSSPSPCHRLDSALAVASGGCGYRPGLPSPTIQPTQSRVTLTSFDSVTTTTTLTMTSLEWVRCGSGGKVCIFLVLGIILLMLGIFIGAFYLNIQQLTTSSALTELLPNYVIALSVMLIGFSVMILFWKRSRVLLFIAMVLNVSGFLLCVLTTILTGTHILKPIISITYCEYRASSKVCVCYSPYKRDNLIMNHSEKKLFRLLFYGSSNCNIKTLLPKMLYVLCAITLIAALVCAISYLITLRVYRMKKNKEDELDDEAFEHEDLHRINRDDSYLSSRCQDNTYSGIPPSPESPVPLLEAVSSRGIKVVDKSSILRDLLPDLGKKRIVKRSQSFSYHGRSVEGTCDSLDDEKMLDRTNPRHSKGRNIPCRTLSETVRPSSAGTPDNFKRKFSKPEVKGVTEDNLDKRQLLLILGLHMRNIQEQHEAEIQSIQQENIRRAKTPQPYYPAGKEGYMVGRRAYTPQPAKSQFPTMKPNEYHPQVQPPRRRQLFTDSEEVHKPTRRAKGFAEAMMNDMVCDGQEDLTSQQIEMEPLPFCTLDGIPDHERTPKMNKLKQGDTFYIPKARTVQQNFINSPTMVDPKKMSALHRNLSNAVPTSKNDSVFIVPLYEKIDTPEHDILQSSIHERIIPINDGQQIISHNGIAERIYRRTPSPFGVIPSSSENLYSKATKPGDSLYGKISKKFDRTSPVNLEQTQSYKYICQSPQKEIDGHVTNMAEVGLRSKQYVKSIEDDCHLRFSPQKHKYVINELFQGTPVYKEPQQDMLDLSVTPESLTSDFSPGDAKQERGNISGTSTEFSPPGNNQNRSNASGTSVDYSPSAFQEVRKLCDTPIIHPKMLPSTPTDSPTSPNEDTVHHGQSRKNKSLGIVCSPDDGHSSYHDLSGSKEHTFRNVSGESTHFSPIESHPHYFSPKYEYSPSRHIVETNKSLPSSSSSSLSVPAEKSTRGNISGASAKSSPCRNMPHPSVTQMLTPKTAPASVKGVILNNRTASEPPKRNTKHNKKEDQISSIRGRSASLSPHRNPVDDSLGPREQPYGQYGPYSRKIEGCNVYISPSKKDSDDHIQMYKGQKWNVDMESQPRKEKPPPPYPSRSSKSHGESRKNTSRSRGNFRVGPEGVSYRRKKIEKLDMSFDDQVDDIPRSELDVEGDVDREELYPTPEKKWILGEYEFHKPLEDQQSFLLLRDKGSGSDSDALETVI